MSNSNVGFLIMEDWVPAIESLSGDDAKELILALINRQLYGEPFPKFSSKQTEIYARMIEPTIKRRLDGKKGGNRTRDERQKGTTVDTMVDTTLDTMVASKAKQSKNKQSKNKQSKNKQSNISIVSSNEETLEARFDRFWKVYPRKQAKKDAYRAFQKLKPSEELLQVMIAAIEDQKTWENWTKDGGKFIPLPATWLNRGQWEDENELQIKDSQEPSNPFLRWLDEHGEEI